MRRKTVPERLARTRKGTLLHSHIVWRGEGVRRIQAWPVDFVKIAGSSRAEALYLNLCGNVCCRVAIHHRESQLAAFRIRRRGDIQIGHVSLPWKSL